MFTDKYRVIRGKELTLRLMETVKSEYAFDLLPFYYYEILDKKNNSVGKISLRIGYNEYTIYNGNVGYEVNQEYRGHNYSLKALKMLKPLMKYHKIDFIILAIDELNTASNKIAQKAKGKLIGKFTVQKQHKFYLDERCKNVYLINTRKL